MTVAILAPVPAILIGSAIKACENEGVVAFGTNAWEVFQKVDEVYGAGIFVIIRRSAMATLKGSAEKSIRDLCSIPESDGAGVAS